MPIDWRSVVLCCAVPAAAVKLLSTAAAGRCTHIAMVAVVHRAGQAINASINRTRFYSVT